MVAFPLLTEPLSDGVVSLRFAEERDIPDVLIAYQDDPELHVRFGAERPPSGAELGRRHEQAEPRRRDAQGITLTILTDHTDISRGELNVQRVDPTHARGELGLWLAPAARGRGYGSRALALGAGWLLGGCGFERLQLLTDPDNLALRGAAQRAGFEFEGILRGHTIERGRRVDAAIFARVVGDP